MKEELGEWNGKDEEDIIIRADTTLPFTQILTPREADPPEGVCATHTQVTSQKTPDPLPSLTPPLQVTRTLKAHIHPFLHLHHLTITNGLIVGKNAPRD
ncbi:hypothetical protein Pcinc_000077 [Petrolisthes cinctipes]|uniref:Uncharacterized protein n=1 Tax=Petrolisthes cinctipes TaxID=88211 RepID=A0AAE1EXX0_PETCI|nr:hypothetical protein Pcinc_030674 [Petrolisthes cinctipes]KAK3896256.1 hypothetical protein Pcinc_000077 [Petrolisthes cinctipes]